MALLLAVPAAAVAAAPATLAHAAPAWVFVASPSPHPTDNDLLSVWARTATDAWAVGVFGETAEEDEDGGLILHWNGSAWNQVSGPNPQFRNEILNGVSGTSATDVWAVGGISTQQANLPRLPWAVHWNGTAWSEVPVPAGPAGTVRSTLRAVAAISPTNAWAVGRSGAGTVLIEHWNGAAWSVTPAPAVNTGLNALAVVSPTNIWATGDQVVNADGSRSALIVHYDGVSWQVVPNQVAVPSTFVAHNGLKSLVALSATNIWAVGSAKDRLSVDQPVIQHYNGTAWTRVATPAPPANTTHYNLTGIAAATATDITAVGAQSHTDLTESVASLRGNGMSFLQELTPHTAHPADGLTAVAVTPGGGPTWAVGRSFLDNGGRVTLIMRR